MATALKIEPEQVAGTSIMAIIEHNPVIVLTDANSAEQLFAEVKAECDAFVVDLTTKKGRDALRAQASKVITTKTTIDKAGLALTKQWRDQTKVVNDARAEITLRLDAMAKDVRRPLTEWEDAEKARVDRCREIVERIHGAAIVTMDDTAATVRARGFEIWGVEIGSDFGDLANEAANAKEATVATLKAALVRLEKEEADRAELERLRAEAAERAEADRIAAEQAEAQRREAARLEAERVAAEQAKAEAVKQAALAEERRVAAEKAEAERIERARQEAAEAAQREEARKAAEAQAERDRAHAAELAKAQRERDEAEAARKAEADRIAAEEVARQAEAQRLADEQAKREADQKHRTAVKAAAKTAIMSCGADEETARKIVMAIIAGEVPAVTLRF